MDSSKNYSLSLTNTRRDQAIKCLSVVLPAYNEARNLEVLLPLLITQLHGIAQNLELIVVDDGSKDDTLAAVQTLGRQGLPVRLIELSRNFGKEVALTAGLDHASGDVVVTMDSDGQHPLEVLPLMLEKWRAGFDVIYGVQVDRRHSQPVLRRGLTKLFYRLMSAGTGLEIPSDAGDFRLLDRGAVDALKRLPERTRYMKGLFAWVGFRSTPVPFVPGDRLHGETNFHYRKLFSLAVTGLTAFTQLPLRVVTAVGILISLAALFYGLFIVVNTLFYGNPISGYATIAASIMLFSGIQLLALGVIAEYLGRVFDEVKHRPLYIVRDVWVADSSDRVNT